MNIEIKKDLTSNWFKMIRDSICDSITYLENNKFLYFEQAKKDVKKYNEFYDSTHTALKDLSIGDVSYTILINKNL